MQLSAIQSYPVCTVAIVWPNPYQFCISPGEKRNIGQLGIESFARELQVSHLQFHAATCQYCNWLVPNAHSTWPHRWSIGPVRLRCDRPASTIYPPDFDWFSVHACAIHAIARICLATQSHCPPTRKKIEPRINEFPQKKKNIMKCTSTCLLLSCRQAASIAISCWLFSANAFFKWFISAWTFASHIICYGKLGKNEFRNYFSIRSRKKKT